MGCTQSKIENEEAVARCKERKLHMKEAVSSRNAFAAAHSAYAMSLKNTGAALSDYAHGEVQNPHAAGGPPSSAANPGGGFDSLPPPPPPLPNFSSAPPPPLQRATSMPEIKLSKPVEPKTLGPTTIEEGDEDDEDENDLSSSSLRRRSSRRSRREEEEEERDEDDEDENENDLSSSSLRRRRSSRLSRREEEERDDEPPPPAPPVTLPQPMPPPPQQQHQAMEGWGDYFFMPMDSIPGPTLSTTSLNEEVRINSEEIERKAFQERPKRAEQAQPQPQVVEKVKVVEQQSMPMPPVPPAPAEAAAAAAAAVKNAKKGKQGVGPGPAVEGGKRAVKANINLLQIFIDLDDHFLKASESAHEVSKMLEAARLHYHSNFADNRGHIDHSARVMRVITWNRSFRGLPNNDDAKDDFDSEEQETHATVLDKLLAWEKKLYDEVKAGELMKYEYQRKVSLLNKQKKKGSRPESLEKTKAAVSHLHTRYIVDMQSMDSTVSEINRLRDEQLYPKLVQLVDGMAMMWETMRVEHENQSKIVTALRALDISQSPKETTEHHHERTIQLWAVVQEWHAQFGKLVDHQKEYIRSLNHWLKLNLVPIESNLKEKVSSPPRIQNPPIQSLLLSWHDHLDKLPDELARSAILNFSALINTIMLHQEDEMKSKAACEDTRRELARRTQQFNEWHRKFVERRIPDGADPDRAEEDAHNDAITERKMAVEALQKRLEDEEAAYERQCLQVREKSLTSLRTRLPELFRSMSDFALACSDMYRDLRDMSRP